MEQTNQTPIIAKPAPADERKAWIKPELTKLDVESGGSPQIVEDFKSSFLS